MRLNMTELNEIKSELKGIKMLLAIIGAVVVIAALKYIIIG